MMEKIKKGMEKFREIVQYYWLETTYIVSVLVFTAALGLLHLQDYALEASAELSRQVIRFHVVANSDTVEDQLLKENVRDAVLLYMEPYLEDVATIEASREIIMAYEAEITAVANQVIANWDKDYTVTTDLAMVHFPTKSYGDIVFPEGDYEACRIVIGEGEGENWWCVMYPPLCYVDAATGVVPLEGKQELQENLTKEQYEIVSFQADQPYQIRFKLIEWFNRLE